MSRRIDKEEAAHLQYETEHTEPPKSRSVVLYMGVLIAAAFLLLLVAYFMQQRTASTVQDLQDGLNSFQTIDQLVDDNRALQEEVTRLREEQEALKQELSNTQWERDHAYSQLTDAQDASKMGVQQANALNKLNLIRALYNNGRYREAQALLKEYPDITTTKSFLKAVSDNLSEDERDIYDPLASFQRFVRLLT